MEQNSMSKPARTYFPRTPPVKILLPVLLSMFLFIITFFGFILPKVENHLMDRKREMIHALSESALSTIKYYSSLADQGTITTREAQRQAANHLRSLRYGPDNKDYFWINDTFPRMIMHPYRPDLEGRDVTDEKDPAGKKLFQAFLATVKETGAGFVNYHWQWQDDPTRIFSKISYVQEYAPWHWIIGTGVYVEDVHNQIASITQNMTFIFLGILGVIALLSVYILWQGAAVESRRRSMEISLLESETRYRLLTETAREMILVVDTKQQITFANTAFFRKCGYFPAQLPFLSIFDIVSKEDWELLTNRLAGDGADDEDGSLLELSFLIESGTSLPVEVTFAVMEDLDGNRSSLLTARDISDKKQAEAEAKLRQEQLMQTDKMVALGTLVAGVAHEINNPISSVMLNLQVYERFWESSKPVLDAYHKKYEDFEVGGMTYPQLRERMPRLLHYSQEGVSRVRRIVGDLKEFARQRSSDQQEAVNINEVVRTSVGLLSSLIAKATSCFEVQYDENLPTMLGNSQRLEQVVINLIMNGCQALSHKEQLLAVTTSYLEESEEIILEVYDEGTGMAAEVLERIKDPFFTTKRENSGTGLGLAISDTIIRNHGGWLHFRSEPGQGTTATVRLPRYRPDEIIGRMI